MWFHIEHLGDVERRSRKPGPLTKQLWNLPVVRGWMTTPPGDWMTVGSGRLIRKARTISKETGPHDWESLVGASFISFVNLSPSMFSFYSCPRCEDLI